MDGWGNVFCATKELAKRKFGYHAADYVFCFPLILLFLLMLLKRPKSERNAVSAALPVPESKYPKRKRATVSYKLNVEELDNSSDDDFDGGDDHNAKRRCVRSLNDLSNITRGFNPLSRPSSKDYDPLMVLKRKFAVPVTNPLSVPSDSYGERKTLGLRRRPNTDRLLHDPNAEDALILWDPKDEPKESEKKDSENTAPPPAVVSSEKTKQRPNKSLSEILGLKKKERKKVPVVVDPVLVKILRPHQVEGLKFLYRCTTGKVRPDAHG